MTVIPAAGAPRDRLRLVDRAQTVGAGILDVGAASAATFVCGMLAVRVLQPHVLGAYALAFRVLVLAMGVPASLMFFPREVQAMQLPERDRVRVVGPALRAGVPTAVLAALVAALWPFSVPDGVASRDLVYLNITMCFVVVLSPCQDLLRRALHMSGRSGQAASVSLVQLVVVVIGACFVAFGVVPLPVASLPFGLLALANAVSLAIGMVLLRSDHARPAPVVAGSAEELRRSGAWLLLTGVLPNGTAVLAGVILTQVSGPEALGYLEAARIVAQPILVFAAGLNAVLGPRSMHAAISFQAHRARRLSRQFTTLVLLVGAGYAITFGVPHALNVFAWVSPKAFTVPWIVMVMIVAHVALSISLPERSELLGAGRSRSLAGIEAFAGLASLACALLAVILGVFALPLGLFVQGLIRQVLLRRQAARHYRAGPARGSPDSVPAPEWSATVAGLPETSA